MLKIIDSANAFTQLTNNFTEEQTGPLKGLQFAVKDVFDVIGFCTQAGNPDYFSQAKVADKTAAAITTLQDAGAKLIGKTHTDELGGSLFGLNEHYGAPLNSNSPERVPGGSSSGSAAAVAANLVDFALGADTSGSVRAPASFCGIYGLRPTFGRIPTSGVLPISQPLDTVGIFAQHPQRIAQVLNVYGLKEQAKFTRLRVIPNLIESLSDSLRNIFLERVQLIKELISSETPLVIDADQLTQWSTTIRTIAMYDLWQGHKGWILKEDPKFGGLISDRLNMARMIKDEDYQLALKKKQEIKEFMENSLEPGDIAVFPTVHDIPPLLSSSITELKDFSLKASRHTCISALAGLPEITVPLKNIKENGSLGMSFLGREEDDCSLSFFASQVHSLMRG